MASEPLVQATVKALVFDGDGRILLLRETSGFWDLPGGRLEAGESFEECLRRECREEMAVDCTVLDALPRHAWCAVDKDGNWRVMLCFAATVDAGAIVPSDGCEEHGFFRREELDTLPLYPQTRPLGRFL